MSSARAIAAYLYAAESRAQRPLTEGERSDAESWAARNDESTVRDRIAVLTALDSEYWDGEEELRHAALDRAMELCRKYNWKYDVLASGSA